MELVYSIAIFLAGLIVGSFVNAWILRINTGLSVIGGRSQCMSCSVTLAWYDLVPVASFLVLQGRCRNCDVRFSSQYPIVEMLMGILWALTYGAFGFSWFSLLIGLASVFLVALSVYDFYHTIIPSQFVYPFIGLGIVAVLISGRPLYFLLAGIGLFVFFGLLWLMSNGKWMGFGDAKVALGMGFFLGPAAGVSAVMVAFWAGAIISLILLSLTHLRKVNRFNLKTQIPFAPFLVFALYFTLFTGLVFVPWF